MIPSDIERAATALRANPDPHHLGIPVPPEADDLPSFWRVEFPCIVAVIFIWAFTFIAIGRLS